jgi:mRNA-degrading endonuclease HigB of HigAB toxin-antitoxin module
MKIAEAKAALQALLNSPPSRTWAELEEKERKLKAIKDMGLTDGEVYALIKQVESKLERERAALEEEDARKKRDMLMQSLNKTFSEIANAGNVNIANAKIADAMSMFASGDAPVLIAIYNAAGKKDYDRPTSIRDYLNYLKDQKHSKNRVENFVLDASGKIKELELTKVN